MEQYPIQEQDLIYALDIGTRSVIGILGRREQDRIHVLEIPQRFRRFTPFQWYH